MLKILLFASFSLWASIGKITFLKGEGWIIQGKNKYIIKQGIEINNQDQIVTLEKSFLKILLLDGTTMTLGPHSHLNLESIIIENSQNVKSLYHLTHGLLRAHFSKNSKEGKLNVKTKAVSFGLRGTEVIIEVHENKKEHVSKLGLLSGKIDFTITQGNKSLDIKVGHHFDSKIYHKEGAKAAHQKINTQHLTLLHKNKEFFLHNVHRKGRPYTKYDHPEHFKQLRFIQK